MIVVEYRASRSTLCIDFTRCLQSMYNTRRRTLTSGFGMGPQATCRFLYGIAPPPGNTTYGRQAVRNGRMVFNNPRSLFIWSWFRFSLCSRFQSAFIIYQGFIKCIMHSSISLCSQGSVTPNHQPPVRLSPPWLIQEWDSFSAFLHFENHHKHVNPGRELNFSLRLSRELLQFSTDLHNPSRGFIPSFEHNSDMVGLSSHDH